jgi:hypothetical protein
MVYRSLIALQAAAVAVSLLSIPATAQTAKSADAAKAVKARAVPRTSDGPPDFTGVWSNVTITPMERPRDLAGKEFFTPQEAIQYQQNLVTNRNRDKRDNRGTNSDVANAYNDFWWDSGTKVVKTLRTSLVVDPPDGRVPALTPQRQQQLAADAEAKRKRCAVEVCEPENGGIMGPAAGPEDRPLMERCLQFAGGPPMMPGAYNNNFQFVQSNGFLAIDIEMVHDVRRIPLDGSPHVPANVRQWHGDARGHWDGDTLVVETTNFTDKTRFHGSDENLRLTERFSYLDPDTVLYRYTVDDPTAFTKPWTVEMPMLRLNEYLYEYACNEGNHGMEGILSAARAEERQRAEKGK